jgi:hypothetical protein
MNQTRYCILTRPLAATLSLLSLAVVATLALTSCSSVKTKVDHGPIQAKTFSFLDTGGRTAPVDAEKRQQAHVMVQEAIIKTLASKGVTYVANGGDVTVAYLLIVGNNVTTTSLNGYFGYNSDADALVDKVHKQDTIKSDDRNYFEAGTLVIDILDAKTSKILQRRTIQAEVLRDVTLEARAARVQTLVGQALADVRISQ